MRYVIVTNKYYCRSTTCVHESVSSGQVRSRLMGSQTPPSITKQNKRPVLVKTEDHSQTLLQLDFSAPIVFSVTETQRSKTFQVQSLTKKLDWKEDGIEAFSRLHLTPNSHNSRLKYRTFSSPILSMNPLTDFPATIYFFYVSLEISGFVGETSGIIGENLH